MGQIDTYTINTASFPIGVVLPANSHNPGMVRCCLWLRFFFLWDTLLFFPRPHNLVVQRVPFQPQYHRNLHPLFIGRELRTTTHRLQHQHQDLRSLAQLWLSRLCDLHVFHPNQRIHSISKQSLDRLPTARHPRR